MLLNAEVKYLAHSALVEIEAYIPMIVSKWALPCSIMALTERSGAPRTFAISRADIERK